MSFEIKMLKTPSCGACKKSRKAIEKVSEEFDIDLEIIDLTENPEYAQKYKVMAAPGIIIDGEKQFEGGVKPKELRKKLEELKE
ncbi:MAG: thioredoxin family protein [Candidatus Nanohalobium sp.]